MEPLLLETSNGKWYAAYQIAAIRITLSGLQGHSSTASLSKCEFSSYNCAAVGKISTNIVRHEVTVWQLSFLLPARRCASAVLAVHYKPVFYGNSWTDRSGFWPHILHCVNVLYGNFGILKSNGTYLWNFFTTFGHRKKIATARWSSQDLSPSFDRWPSSVYHTER